MDLFSRLPTELGLLTLKSLPDLSSLHAVITASTFMALVFDNFATEIVAEIARSCYYSTEVKFLLYAAGLFMTPGIARDSIGRTCHYHPDLETYKSSASSDTVLPEKIPVQSIHRLVAAAADIENLCHSFFQVHLERIHALRPTHHLKVGITGFQRVVPEYDLTVAGPAYSIADTGPPSWVEKQRVLRALWYIWIDIELTPVISAHPKMWENEEELKDFQRELLLNTLTHWEVDEKQCVYDYLMEIRDLDSLLPSEFEAKLSRLPRPPPTTGSKPEWPTPTPQEDDTEGHVAQPVILEYGITKRSPASHLFSVMYRRGRLPGDLGGTTWPAWRRLGFGVWDLERMCQMEMMNDWRDDQDAANYGVGKKYLSMSEIKFTWLSVLRENQIIISQRDQAH